MAIATEGRDLSLDEVEAMIPYVGSNDGMNFLRDAAGGRVLKTHEVPSARYKRGIFLVRDVREVFSSYYRAELNEGRPPASNEEFVMAFFENGVTPYGDWLSHTKSWLVFVESNINWRFVKYSYLKAHPEIVLLEIMRTMGMPISEDEARLAVSRASMAALRDKELESEKMKRNRLATGISFFGSRNVGEAEALKIFDKILVRQFRAVKDLNDSVMRTSNLA